MSNEPAIDKVEHHILEREGQWALAIQQQDPVAAALYLADSYTLIIAVEGQPLQTVPRAAWLAALPAYQTHSFSADDSRIHVYGATAVVFMLFTQQATVRGQDRSGQFAITDIWVQQAGTWRVAERHSSRPEVRAIVRPQ